AVVEKGRDVPEGDEVVRDDEGSGMDRLLEGSGRRGPDDVARPDFLERPEVRTVVQFVRRDPMVLAMSGQEGHGHAGMTAHPRRIAWGSVRGHEELRLLLFQLEGVAEGGASDNPDQRRGHGIRREPVLQSRFRPRANDRGPTRGLRAWTG